MRLDDRAFAVLYADGDSDDLRAFREAASGLSVLSASSGEQALHVLERQEVAVVVADQALPDMSGVELLCRARELRPSAVRLMTGRAPTAALALAAINEAAVSAFIEKPWRPEWLGKLLRGALEQRRAQSSIEGMEMRLWHGGQVAAAATIYEELVHELSNPLGALEINASLVADLLESAEQSESVQAARGSLESAREAHADSIAALEQMKSLVSRMRQGRRPARDQARGSCQASSVVEATVRIVRAEAEKVARLGVELDLPRPAIVLMDASVLGQVLLNLLLNALQAFPTSAPSRNRVKVLGQIVSSGLSLRVEDNGPGIALEHLDQVFEPFFTTKENGTGLGLAICRELVTRAHGTIAVQNVGSGGASFEITLPIAKSD